MIDRDALVHAFQEFAGALLQSYDIGPTLYRLTDQVTDVLKIDGAGLSLSRDGATLTFVSATDGDIAAIEEEQVERGEGPCVHAFRSGEQVVVADLTTDARFPGYRPGALDRGVRAVAGIPMPVGDQRIGALDLYREVPYAWSQEELEVAQLLADMASGYVLHTTELQRSQTLAGQLQHALDSRLVIEQAKGILVERHGITPTEAFNLLRSRSQSTNTRIHTVAARVVDHSGEL